MTLRWTYVLVLAASLFAGGSAVAQQIGNPPVLIVGTISLIGGTPNGVLYNNAGVLGNLATSNNGVLVTNGSGVPSISTTLPSGLAATNLTLTTPTITAAQTTNPIAVVSPTVDQTQLSGSTLIAVASATSIAAGQLVSGTNIPAGDQVASVVSTPKATLTANGISNSGQAVLTTTNTTGVAVGQLCVDTTTPAAIGAGNAILSIQAGTSITMTSNLAAATANNDSIVCDPTVKLTQQTSGAATGTINFYANAAALSASSAIVDNGDLSVYGNVNVGQVLSFPFNSTNNPPVEPANAISIRGAGMALRQNSIDFLYGNSGTATFPGSVAVTTNLALGGGNLSIAAWTTNGVVLNLLSATYNDTTSSGTVALNYLSAFQQPTLTATNPTTYTVACTVCIANAPLASTNVTITGDYALYVAAGASLFVSPVITNSYVSVNGNTLPATAAGRLAMSGEAAVPTMSANGEAAVFITSTTGGLSLMGKGSATDLTVYNSSGGTVCTVPTGNTNLLCGQIVPTGSGAPTVGMYLPAAGKLGLAGTTSELFSGATDVFDYGVTTASVFTVPVAATFSSASFLLTGVTTGTNADFLCKASAGTVLIQTSACTISSMRFKNFLGDYRDSAGLHAALSLDPIIFTRKRDDDHPDVDWNAYQPQIGLSAENVAAVEPRCAIYEQDGITPKSYRQECIIAVLVAAVKTQQAELDTLRHHRGTMQ